MIDRQKAIEVMARAAFAVWEEAYDICQTWEDRDEDVQQSFMDESTAALDALLAMLPTEEMVETFYRAHREDVLAGNIYRLENVRVGLAAALGHLKGSK